MPHPFSVFITRKIPEAGIERLKSFCSIVEVNPHDRNPTPQELKRAVADKDALLCILADKIDAELLASAPRLKIVATMAAGYDNIDLAAARKRNIVVTNVPDVLTDATADLTLALILSVARRIVEGDAIARKGRWVWSPTLLLGVDLADKTLGIVGAGRIGQAVGRRALGFKMKVIYTANSPKPQFEKETGAKMVDLEQLLRTSDFISLNCPLTSQTHHLIGERQFALMKKSAFLINTSRGQVIDEKALVSALKNGQIAGAGLDVYEFEPNVSPELLTMPNVVLLPHIGSATTETRTKMAVMAAENIIAVLSGKPPLNPIKI